MLLRMLNNCKIITVNISSIDDPDFFLKHALLTPQHTHRDIRIYNPY